MRAGGALPPVHHRRGCSAPCARPAPTLMTLGRRRRSETRRSLEVVVFESVGFKVGTTSIFERRRSVRRAFVLPRETLHTLPKMKSPAPHLGEFY